MDKDKLRKKVDEQTARDHTKLRHWTERRRNRYERLMNEPLLPRFCSVCFLCMVIGTAAGVIFDLYGAFTFPYVPAAQALLNAAASALFVWLFFSVPLLPCLLVQRSRGFDDPYFEKTRLNRRGKPKMPIEKRFRLYLVVTCTGLAVFFLLYLLSRIFLA